MPRISKPKEVVIAPPSEFSEYWAAQNWLLSLIQDPQGLRYTTPRPHATRLAEMKGQIPRLAAYLEAAGNPQTHFNSVHVAGTSGKGSVTEMLSSMLFAAGVPAGHHTSPYLQVCNEKLVASGRLIAPSEFVTLVANFRHSYHRWQQSYPKRYLKYGEAWVALTLEFMARAQVEWGIIETGMGGRYDPTNIIDSQISVITNVSFDHTESLGSTLKEIAWHKAGIIKPGRPVLTTETKAEPLQTISELAATNQSPLFVLGRDFQFGIQQTGNSKMLNVAAPYHRYDEIELGVTGDHQYQNAALAISTLDVLIQQGKLDISVAAVRRGLNQLKLSGRYETMQTEPQIILDGAHNPAKIAALQQKLVADFPGQRIRFVFGMLLTKDARAMLELLTPLARQWYLTQPVVLGKPALPAEQLQKLLLEMSTPPRQTPTFPTVVAALAAAMSDATADEIIVVTGSIYLIGEARNHWHPTEEILKNLEANVANTLSNP